MMHTFSANAEPLWISGFQWASRIIAGVVVSLALCILAGWWLGATTLTELIAGRPKTVPNTALGLLFNGLAALWLHPGRHGPGWRKLASPIAAALGMSLGALTLAEYVFFVDLRVDCFFFQLMDIDYSADIRFPGRPSPQTAICISLIGLALLLVEQDVRRGRRRAEVLVSLAGFLALVQLTAHVYDAAALYSLRKAPATGMGLFTVTGILLLVCSVLFAHPERGWVAALVRRTPGGYLARRLVPLSLVVPVAIGLCVEIARLAGVDDIALAFALMVALTVPFAVGLCLVIARTIDRAQAEREAATAWLQGVIDEMPEGVILANAEGKLFCNRATVAVISRQLELGEACCCDADLDIRRPSGELVPWEHFPLARALSTGEPVQNEEFVLRTHDGSDLSVLVKASPMRGGGAVAVLQDISLLKHLERLREEWTAVVAHDLRQPISAILMSAEALRLTHKDSLSKHEEKLLSGIRSSVGHLTRMTEDLLDMSRIESNRLRLQREEVDVSALIREIVDRSDRLFEGRRLHVKVVGEIFTVKADPQRVTQIFSNLLSNAVKYGSPGTDINVVVKGEEREIEVAVTNRGAGIPEEEIPRLFSRYYRTKSAEAGAAAGLGLGLYIVKGLVEAHKGRISVTSAPDGETTFRFTLPRRASEERGPTPPRPSES